MLLGGDEMGRTQRGNNNAYCQDGELTWFDWAHIDEELLAFTRAHRVPAGASGVPAQPVPVRGKAALLRWFTPAGTVDRSAMGRPGRPQRRHPPGR